MKITIDNYIIVQNHQIKAKQANSKIYIQKFQSKIKVIKKKILFFFRYEKKYGGIFSQSYIVYHVETEQLNWSVQRRYNDFCWLRETLEKAYPAICIPPIPKKKSTRSFQPLFLSKRMAFMEHFLNKLLKQPELKCSKYLEGFLGMTSDDQFLKLKKEGENLQKIQKVQNMVTINGKAECVINQEINQYLKKANEFFSNQDIIYKKIRKLCKQLIIDFDQLSTTLFSIGDCFSQQYQISYLFNNSNENQEPLLEELYINLNNLNVAWGNNITNQIKFVQENLSNWYKYYNNETQIIKDVIQLLFIQLLKNQQDINQKRLCRERILSFQTKSQLQKRKILQNGRSYQMGYSQ
ncbi:PX domain protein [Ichthyophthirius multifiliis]|uniref:PX domain protein n=1 Tax=Ichthyophthirius multifiliis TaxID=5932 RepID=G0QSV9_ICHMU|nr:PX domain protein [Ichthyophthirius multifiliis]EGR31692.1 PX domain protein [Ichthyophthirius multifiliis]|eukprot:XP_004035178.1 PX domain protein [Ichthyophthirius multifiliis]